MCAAVPAIMTVQEAMLSKQYYKSYSYFWNPHSESLHWVLLWEMTVGIYYIDFINMANGFYNYITRQSIY